MSNNFEWDERNRPSLKSRVNQVGGHFKRNWRKYALGAAVGGLGLASRYASQYKRPDQGQVIADKVIDNTPKGQPVTINNKPIMTYRERGKDNYDPITQANVKMPVKVKQRTPYKFSA